MPGPRFPGQVPAECGHYYPDVLRLRDERKPDGTFVRIVDCTYCGQYELPLDARYLDKEIIRKLKRSGRDVAIRDDEVARVRQQGFTTMMSTSKQAQGMTLQSLIETACRQGADTIRMEYVTEGLEVTYARRGLSIYYVVTNREAIRTIVGELVSQAGLEHKARGKFKFVYDGREYEIRAEEYDSFGESAFRLTLKRAR